MPKLPELVQALLDPKIYPDTPQRVEMVQTQMSFVFLTDRFVYKVKKPVDLGYLDYTTLDKRHALCHKEVELNRRLCPDAYLGVLSITRGESGISIEGEGEVIEYAVKMRRLPQERMLDVLLANNQVTTEMIARVAERVAEFHRKAEPVTGLGGLDTLTTNTEENFSQTEAYIGRTISEERYRHIRDWTRRFIAGNASLFGKRVADGKIKDCHGDLHAAHICFTDGICIYDCIEFNDRFRYCDVAAEVAFLAMDLDRYGRADLSQGFVDAYVDRSGDREIPELLNYYKCYFAYVRGKVNNFQLDDPHIPEKEKEKTREVARHYFELAESYI
jgi:aminoglycoside phosphotransferase family enzyme